MHIIQLANFHGPRSGGIKTALHELAIRYVAQDNRCTLVVPGEQDRVRETPCGTVIEVRAPLVPGLGGYRVIVDVQHVEALMRRLAPDVIELSDKSTLVGVAGRARRRGSAVVLVSHERLDAVFGHVTRLPGPTSSAVRRYDRRLADRVDTIVCASRFAAAEFEGVTTVPIEHIPLGVDLQTFRPRVGPRRPGPLRIVSVVRLSPEKSPHLLVDTSRALAGRGVAHEFVVIGDGPRRAQLARRARGLPIRFLGHLTDRGAVAEAMRSADVGIAPGRNETFGLAALELLASGTPVVVPDRGALSEVVTEGVGIASNSTGPAFADAVDCLSRAPDPSMRVAARQRAEHFEWDTAANSFLDLFDRMVAPRRQISA